MYKGYEFKVGEIVEFKSFEDFLDDGHELHYDGVDYYIHTYHHITQRDAISCGGQYARITHIAETGQEVQIEWLGVNPNTANFYSLDMFKPTIFMYNETEYNTNKSIKEIKKWLEV